MLFTGILSFSSISFFLTPFIITVFNSLPDDKILDWSKLKQIADNILKSISNET